MWKTILDRLKYQLKGERGVRLVVILGVAGLALILLSSFFSSDEEAPKEESVQTQADTSEELAQYCSQMEAQLVEILEQVDGVGTCQVMLRATSTAENVYVQNEETDAEDSRIQEKRSVVVISDSGGERALVQQVVSPQISGVIVVCSGASSSIVKERVSNAVQAVLDLPANRICIVPAAS